MPRECYHVIGRGLERRYIFEDAVDCALAGQLCRSGYRKGGRPAKRKIEANSLAKL